MTTPNRHWSGLVRELSPSIGLLIAMGVLSAACAGAPPPVVASAAPSDPHFPIVPMHLTAHNGSPRTDLELRADGVIYDGSHAVGRITGARLLDERGREIFANSDSATVTIQRRRRHVQIADSGSLTFDENERWYFDDAGRVVQARPGHPPQWVNLQLQGLRADAMGTGAMMVLFNMARSAHR